MTQRSFRIWIAVVLIVFAIVTLGFQSICAPDKNPVSAAVSNYVDKNIAKPQSTKPVDPFSYDGIKNVMVRWVSAYCKR